MGRRWVIRTGVALLAMTTPALAQTPADPAEPGSTAAFPESVETPAPADATPVPPASSSPPAAPAPGSDANAGVAVPPPPPPGLAPPSPPPVLPAPSPPPANFHAKRHDGFFFRIATGFAYLGDSVSSEAFRSASFRGFGTADELSFGGTVASGFVIGGGFQDVLVFSPRLVIDGKDARRPGFLGLSMVGAFGDYYFDPTRGLHAQLFLGLALLQADESRAEEDPGGFGASIAFGDDFWVSDEWSIGVLARLSYAGLVFEPAGYDERHAVVAPALLATFTYH